MSLTVTPSGGGAVTYADASSSFDRAAGKVWIECKVKYDAARIIRVEAAGVNGAAVGRLGDAYPKIEALVAYISAAANQDGGYAADLDAMQGVKVTVVTPQNGTFENCEFLGAEQIEPAAKATGGGTYMLTARLMFEKMR